MARFTTAGLAAGEPVILIVAEAHREPLVKRLRLKGCRVESVAAAGQLTLLDAHETLSKFMVDRQPDWEKFSSIIGSVIEKSREGRRDAPVRVYGEMVDLLWRGGNERDLTQRRALEEERIARGVAELENTRLTRAQETLERALAEQKKVEELREQLLGVVGHDLRAPLSSIMMAAALMLKRGTLHEPDAKAIARIARSADRMSKIISQVLDFTRARLGGGIPIDPKPTDFAEVCEEVIAEYETAHPDRRLTLDADMDSKGVWDRERLAQVVGNLVGNAIQHGKPDGSINVRLRDQGDAVCLLVHNDGSPIPAEQLPSIFDPFRRGATYTTWKTEGLGLGLFIVREMVRAHHGEIRVESTEAEGTTFIVTLSRKPPTSQPQA